MAFVDGIISPVPEDNKAAFQAEAARMAPIYLEHGATRVTECWGADVPHGTTTDFFMAVKAEAGETVVLSWVEWPSREARDAGWQKIMADERMKPDHQLFDGKRMFWGGFETIVDTAEG